MADLLIKNVRIMQTEPPFEVKESMDVVVDGSFITRIGKNLDVDIPIVGDLTLVLEQLLDVVKGGGDHSEWKRTLDGFREDKPAEPAPTGYVNPKLFIQTLDKYLPDNAVVVADVGQNQFWTARNITLNGGRFLSSGGMGTMGYSLPAAIGAKLADLSDEELFTPVIAVCGDGSFQMQMMELATAVQHDVPIKVIVMRNNYLGMVRELQERAYANRLTAVSLDGSPSFTKIAEAYGIGSELVDSPEKIDAAIRRMFSCDKPYLIEAAVEEYEKTIL